ncbi:MAG: lipid-A-disaccharide synthase [gamma proteobacterium symbiont of Bathyaustriella thionipta]|nr:lipid-A-disaccharide synthase [gamma proteobacterium symbiont of Bathyaustriella thionipta]MCU7948574.1 lipid-A-disaccharide synthase [gamma proteobacterium symbiont of Bathyaustriella thionipta]MCU7953305.1 lipid-A-disaccharide synthase [gamma proteobacterium symbiont of Bathyaustriella thionipta]MCU7955080.1 lipid-A-disaccharide synthase [gamma proteobacterium symbiont of Bathyaustriella thionipta]MCU7966996.1 lipid-A-disaccharide synthase [gamma proteobacterium symbiont of Bathyaustriella
MRIGIIAGEASGDILAAGLISAILKQYPDAQFEGIAGPLMVEAGCKAIYPAEKLSVMGLVEVLAHYRELSSIRKELIRHFINNPPDVFIGIDAPDFNLVVESTLKQAGIGTIHYVSPSVWAWRQYRLGKISRAVDLMLTLFPFEARFYENHNISVKYIGHTLADEIDMHIDIHQARQKIQLEVGPEQSVVAVLPGSRMSEVTRLAKPFIETLLHCLHLRPNLIFTIPFVNEKTRQFFMQELNQLTVNNPDVRSQFMPFDGCSRDVMAASDAVLLASGTAALEALLLKKPMLVAYKLSPVTYWVAKRLLKVPYYSLPNLLAGDSLVEEITQNEVRSDVLAPKLLSLLSNELWQSKLEIFDDIHKLLRQNADQTAAQAVIDYLNEHGKLR